MIAAASKSSFKAADDWVEKTMGLKSSAVASAPNEKEPVILLENNKLHPYHAVKKLFQSLPEDSIVCVDGGEAGGWALQCLNEARPRLSMVTTGYLGCLGNGWGYSLGKSFGPGFSSTQRLTIFNRCCRGFSRHFGCQLAG